MAITNLDAIKPSDSQNFDVNGNLSNQGLKELCIAISELVQQVDQEIYFPLATGDFKSAHPRRMGKVSALMEKGDRI